MTQNFVQVIQFGVLGILVCVLLVLLSWIVLYFIHMAIHPSILLVLWILGGIWVPVFTAVIFVLGLSLICALLIREAYINLRN